MDDVAGKGIVVTGAGSGVGEAIANCFAQKGARVVTWGRNIKRLEEARSKTGKMSEYL